MVFQIHYFDTLDSTNEWLKKTAAQGFLSPGAVVQAGYQTAGRGRLGRAWEAHPEAGLLFSMLLDPPLPESHLPLVGLLISLGVVDWLLPLIADPNKLDLRWPNDVLFDGKKLCGILGEAAVNPYGKKLVVVGVGVNVNQTPEEFHADLRTPATSLYQISGKRFAPATLLPELLRAIGGLLDRLYSEGWEWIAREWIERSELTGCAIEVADGLARTKGIVTDILPDGAIVLTLRNGAKRIIRSGDMNSL